MIMDDDSKTAENCRQLSIIQLSLEQSYEGANIHLKIVDLYIHQLKLIQLLCTNREQSLDILVSVYSFPCGIREYSQQFAKDALIEIKKPKCKKGIDGSMVIRVDDYQNISFEGKFKRRNKKKKKKQPIAAQQIKGNIEVPIQKQEQTVLTDIYTWLEGLNPLISDHLRKNHRKIFSDSMQQVGQNAVRERISTQKLQSIKAKCKQFIQQDNYGQAYLQYKILLEAQLSIKDQIILLMNMGIMCLHMNQKISYQFYMQKILQLDPNNQKAYYHLYKSKVLQLVGCRNPGLYERLIEQVNQNKLLSSKTKIDLVNIIIFQRTFHLDAGIDWLKAIETEQLAQYINPKLRICFSKGKEGIYANQDIRSGEILLIQKPIYYDQKHLIINDQNRGFYMNPQFSVSFFYQYMDFDQLNIKINKLAAFDLNIQKYPTPQHEKDMTAISRLFQKHAVLHRNFKLQLINLYQPLFQAIYYISRFISFSCQFNCKMTNIGKYGLTIASKNIKKGEKIYKSLFQSYSYQMREQKYRSFEMECKCVYCRAQQGLTKQFSSTNYLCYFSQSPDRLQLMISQYEPIFNNILTIYTIGLLYGTYGCEKFADQMLLRIFKMSQAQLQQMKTKIFIKR